MKKHEPTICVNCLWHHTCKNLCTMSPQHISTKEARKRIEAAKKQLQESIQAKSVPEEQIDYLQGVLDRGVKNCDKSEKEFASKKGKKETI